jgi:gas vesicle protein
MLQSSIKDGLQSLQNLSSDDILEALGLQRRRGALETALVPSLAMFAAGAAVGAAAALLFAPKAGTTLRRELTDTAKDYSQRLGATASGVAQDVKDALPFGDDATKEGARTGGANSGHATRRV